MPWGHPSNCKGNAPLRIKYTSVCELETVPFTGGCGSELCSDGLTLSQLGPKYPVQLLKVLHLSLPKGLRDHDGLTKHVCWQGTSTTDLSSGDCLLLVLWEILGNLSLCYRGCEQPHARTRVTYIGGEDRFWTSESPSG